MNRKEQYDLTMKSIRMAARCCVDYGLDQETAAIYLKEEMVVDFMPEELKAIARAMMEEGTKP